MAKNRSDIDRKFKWKLEDIFASDELWLEEFNRLQQDKELLVKYKGKLNNKADILACLRDDDNLTYSICRLYVYARMRKDEDVSVSKYQEMTDMIENLAVEISSISSFVRVELTANSTDFLLQLADSEEFKDYDYTLREIARNKEHCLSEKEEKLLAESGSFAGLFHDAFTMLDNADIDFPPFVNSAGEEVKLSHGLYSVYMQSEDREDRRKAFESMFLAYKNMINTISVLYAGNVKKDIFYSKARGYDSCLQKAMNEENVSPVVYEKLIKCINDNLPVLHDYLDYRTECLGYDELHMYDLHTAIVEQGSIKADYDQAKQIVLDALKPLGAEYQGLLNKAFSEGWIDVYENKGKKSGAYSWGCYGTHPYVLLNFNGTVHDIFTIAHELGHAMHTYYSNSSLPFNKADYEIFVAEVASTVNETLLLRDLLSKCNKEDKKYLLSYLLDMFRTTVFRQTQFAEFEAKAHDMAENGESLTPDSLCELYMGLNKKYYGSRTMVSDDLIQYEWARIPHFYTSFYVYKYSTGLISAVCIADDILTNGEEAVARYKQFLSSGGSMPPVEILKIAGVDLTTDEPYQKAMKIFAKTLQELKSL